MKMIAKTALILLLAFGTVNSLIIKRQIGGSGGAANSPRATDVSSQRTKIINAIQELALDISASQWEQRLSGNVVQSPVSIAALLSLLLLASRGDSHAELKRTLHYPNDITDQVIHSIYREILNSIGQTSSGVEVSMSSRLFLQEGLSILGQFTTVAEQSYGSSVRGVNFAGAPTTSMNTINDWIEKSTKGKITDLISNPFSTDTKFVAANAIYFNGEWENSFSSKLTENGIFNTGNRNITIPMMTTLMTVPYLKGDQLGFDMISLPYKGNKYSMYILTPRGKAGIQSMQRMEYNLDANIINNLIGIMKTQRVSVQIPRMKLSHKIFLKDDLKTLGVNQIFDSRKADFGRLTSATGIYVNDIVHEAILEVTETGTVAAAASASVFDRIGGQETFRMNRPSLLFIRDNTNGLVLFWARVMEPKPFFN